MNLKTDKLYFYICLGLCFLISGFFFFRGVLPRVNTFFNLKKELERREIELKRLYDTVRQNQILKQEIAESEEAYGSLNNMLFLPNDVSGAVKEIANISQDLQIDFISLAPQSAKLIKSSAEVGFSLWETPISIKIKTSYAKLLDFVKRIEDSVKFIKIESFQVRKNPSTLLVHDAQMTLCVYSLQQEKSQ